MEDAMAEPLDFYFDYSSPPGYVASTRIDAIAAAYGRAVNWRPVLLGAIFKVTGQQPLLNVPIKGTYAKHDFLRTARLNGVEMRFPSTFPFSSVAAARAHYWLADRDPKAAVRFTQAVLHAAWAEDRDVAAIPTVLAIAGSLGHDEAELEAALSSQQVKDRLKSEVEAAVARGVFGSPYVIVDGEPFWGADRLEQVEKWLKTGGW
jgi:2-hydroxychromene-2-carboxylate isomerase